MQVYIGRVSLFYRLNQQKLICKYSKIKLRIFVDNMYFLFILKIHQCPSPFNGVSVYVSMYLFICVYIGIYVGIYQFIDLYIISFISV
jgi:hypothetical protein